MNQIPARTASTVTDFTGIAAMMIPPSRLTIPKNIHQPRPPSVSPEEPTGHRGQALDDQASR